MNSSKTESLKLIFLNIQLNIQSIVAKRVSFSVLLDEYDPDINAVSETWLSPDISTSEFFPDQYNVFRKGRVDLNCNQPVIICSFYRPPNKDNLRVNNLCNLFANITSTYPNVSTWFVGDLNLLSIDWKNNCTKDSAYPFVLCDTIINFVQEHGFSQSIDFPIRVDNILEVFITNRPSLLHSCNPIAGISDHEAICIESSISFTQQQYANRKSFLWHKADMTSIKEIINQFTTDFLNNYSLSTPVDTLWKKFKQMCLSCLSHVPTRQFSTQTKRPWMTTRIKRLSCKNQHLYNIARQSHCS